MPEMTKATEMVAFVVIRSRRHSPRHRTLLISEPSYDQFHRVAVGCVYIIRILEILSSVGTCWQRLKGFGKRLCRAAVIARDIPR